MSIHTVVYKKNRREFYHEELKTRMSSEYNTLFVGSPINTNNSVLDPATRWNHVLC